jgi:hypothetical protein
MDCRSTRFWKIVSMKFDTNTALEFRKSDAIFPATTKDPTDANPGTVEAMKCGSTITLTFAAPKLVRN